MQHERLEPGTHLRKNTKQILAMLRATAQRAGLAGEFEQPSSSKARLALTGADGAAAGTVEVAFTTDGIELVAKGAAAERRALALYTDTRWMMEEFEAFVADSGR